MGRPLAALLILVLALAGCARVSESRVNPFNWFGRAAPATLAPEGGYAQAAVDRRPLVAEVTGLRVQPVHGGALVTATGLPPTQGWWAPELVVEAEPAPAGLLVAPAQELRLRFVVAPPREPRRSSTPQSREVSAGLFLTHHALAGIRRITVTGEANALGVSR